MWIPNFGPNQSALELIQEQFEEDRCAARLKSYIVPEALKRCDTRVGEIVPPRSVGNASVSPLPGPL